MNIKQMCDYLGAMISDGIPPNTPICIPIEGEPQEINAAELLEGWFQEDPAPKMPGSNRSVGSFLILEGWREERFSLTEGGRGYRESDIAEPPSKSTR